MAARIGVAIVWIFALCAVAAARWVLRADATLAIDADLARASVFLDGGEHGALNGEGRATVRLTSGQHVVELRCHDRIVSSYELHAAGSASIPWIVRSSFSTRRMCAASDDLPVAPPAPSSTRSIATSVAEDAGIAAPAAPLANVPHPCVGTWFGRVLTVYGEDECPIALTVSAGDSEGSASSRLRFCGSLVGSRPLEARAGDYVAQFSGQGIRARLSCSGPNDGRGYLSTDDGAIPLRRRGPR